MRAWLLPLVLLIFVAVRPVTAAGASPRDAEWGTDAIESAIAKGGFDLAFNKPVRFSQLGAIEIGGRCYRLIHYSGNEQFGRRTYRIFVFDCARRYLGNYGLNDFAAIPQIVGANVVFPPGLAGGMIRFTQNGPVFATMLNGKEVRFAEAVRNSGEESAAYLYDGPAASGDASLRTAPRKTWTKSSLLHILANAGVTGQNRDPIPGDGDYTLKDLGEIRTGGRCYRNYFYVWNEVQIGEHGRIIHVWNQTPEEAHGFTLHVSKRLLVFRCSGSYLGGYHQIETEPTGVSGTSIYFGCRPDRMKCRSGTDDAITFGAGGPPLQPSLIGERLDFAR